MTTKRQSEADSTLSKRWILLIGIHGFGIQTKIFRSDFVPCFISFIQATAPVVAYYKEKGKLFEIERATAESSPDEVFAKVCQLFDKL